MIGFGAPPSGGSGGGNFGDAFRQAVAGGGAGLFGGSGSLQGGFSGGLQALHDKKKPPAPQQPPAMAGATPQRLGGDQRQALLQAMIARSRGGPTGGTPPVAMGM